MGKVFRNRSSTRPIVIKKYTDHPGEHIKTRKWSHITRKAYNKRRTNRSDGISVRREKMTFFRTWFEYTPACLALEKKRACMSLCVCAFFSFCCVLSGSTPPLKKKRDTPHHHFYAQPFDHNCSFKYPACAGSKATAIYQVLTDPLSSWKRCGEVKALNCLFRFLFTVSPTPPRVDIP